MSLGQKIKSLRKEKGLTQYELGTLLGVKKAAVQKYENGTIKNIKSQTIERLSEIFEVSPSYLLGFKFDDKFPIQELSEEVLLLEKIHRQIGNAGLELYSMIADLNETGIKKLIAYADDIHDKYKKDEVQ